MKPSEVLEIRRIRLQREFVERWGDYQQCLLDVANGPLKQLIAHLKLLNVSMKASDDVFFMFEIDKRVRVLNTAALRQSLCDLMAKEVYLHMHVGLCVQPDEFGAQMSDEAMRSFNESVTQVKH